MIDERIKIHPMEVRDQVHEVWMTRNGDFQIVIDEDTSFVAPTREWLYKKVMEHSRKRRVRIKLPFTALHNGKIVHGTVTGIHASRRALLVEWANGQKEELAPTYRTKFFPPLSPDRISEYQALHERARAAANALEEFEKLYELKVKEEAERLQKEAIAKLPQE